VAPHRAGSSPALGTSKKRGWDDFPTSFCFCIIKFQLTKILCQKVDIGILGHHNPSEQSEKTSGTAHDPKEEAVQLILELAKEVIQKNRGTMSFQVDKKKPRTLITLKFPIERRKVIYYEPISI
jgi:hypothetical protein